MTTEKLHILINFHLQEHTSGRDLPLSLSEDTFARENIGPKKGITRSSFFEAMNDRDIKQFLLAFECLQQQTYKILKTVSQGSPPHFVKAAMDACSRCLPVSNSRYIVMSNMTNGSASGEFASYRIISSIRGGPPS